MNSTTQALIDALDRYMRQDETAGDTDNGVYRQGQQAMSGAISQRTDPWRQAVDEALIAHALDCTGPGDDPKEKVKELIEWAVTIATDPRVSETAAREQEASATGAEPAFYISRKQLPLLGKTPAPYVAYRMAPEGNFDTAVYLATPTTSTTGKVDASRVRDEALSEAVGLYESEDVLAPVGNSAWGEAYQEGWISGAQAYREAIRSLIGTPKSAEGEGT